MKRQNYLEIQPDQVNLNFVHMSTHGVYPDIESGIHSFKYDIYEVQASGIVKARNVKPNKFGSDIIMPDVVVEPIEIGLLVVSFFTDGGIQDLTDLGFHSTINGRIMTWSKSNEPDLGDIPDFRSSYLEEYQQFATKEERANLDKPWSNANLGHYFLEKMFERIREHCSYQPSTHQGPKCLLGLQNMHLAELKKEAKPKT